MKLKTTLITLLAVSAIGHANTSYAETCYEVSGSIISTNKSATKQVGDIDLTLQNDSEVLFSESGSLKGKVTSSATQFGTTILKHKIKFPKGNHFKTKNDVAQIVGVAGVESNGAPCAFFVTESITEISKGSGIFKHASSVDVTANGVLNNCSYLNQNSLTLSGQVCFK